MSAALDLSEALFPSRLSDEEFVWHARGIALASLHSALEFYYRRVTQKPLKGNFIDSLIPWLNSHGNNTLANLSDSLLTLDATRHIVVHNGGLVDDKYIRQVPKCGLVIGERRPLDTHLALALATACLSFGDMIHAIDRSLGS